MCFVFPAEKCNDSHGRVKRRKPLSPESVDRCVREGVALREEPVGNQFQREVQLGAVGHNEALEEARRVEANKGLEVDL